MILAQPDVEAAALQIGNVAGQGLGLRVQRIAPDDPAHVRPPAAFARGVRVALAVAELMMHAMRGHPEDRTALQRERGADGHRVFQPLRRLVAAMGQQPVIAHADAHIDGQNIEHQHHRQPLPGEEEERRHRAEVKCNQHAQRQPVDALAHGCGAAHANR